MLQKLVKNERGSMNIGGIMMLGIAMVFLAIGFIFLPITTDASSDLLSWSYTPYPTITDATFTGFTSVVGITPLLILVGFLAAAVITGMMGIKIMKGTSSASARNPSGLMLLGLAVVFIGISLIIEPVMLDGVSAVVTQKDSHSETDSVATAVGVTTGNYTLTYRLWGDNKAEVTSVTSNITETLLAVASYTYPKLYLSGLSANKTRTITTVYNYAPLIAGTSSFTGYYSILLVAPMLVHIAFLAAAVLSGFFGIRRLSSE